MLFSISKHSQKMILTTDETEETIEVLYNSWYGGWNVSKKAIELYKELSNDPSDENILSYKSRHDPLLLEVYNKLLDKFSGTLAVIKPKRIPKKYENYYDILEYDGKETVEINIKQYETDQRDAKIRDILKNRHLSPAHKVNKLKEMISISFEPA